MNKKKMQRSNKDEKYYIRVFDITTKNKIRRAKRAKRLKENPTPGMKARAIAKALKLANRKPKGGSNKTPKGGAKPIALKKSKVRINGIDLEEHLKRFERNPEAAAS